MELIPLDTNNIEHLAELDAQIRAGNEQVKVIRPWEVDDNDMRWADE